jgi:hypothetical protein
VTTVLQAETLPEYVDQRAIELRTQRAEQSQTASKQASPPAGSSPSSLLDETSAADLFSSAFTLATVSKGTAEKSGLSGATATAFAIVAAMRGQDPLDPTFYNKHAGLRSLAFAVGTETASTGDGDIKTYQVKWRSSGREIANADNVKALKELAKNNSAATLALAAALGRVQDLIIASPDLQAVVAKAARRDSVTLQNVLVIDLAWDQLPPDVKARLDEAILPAVAPLAALNEATQAFIDGVMAKPQFAFAATLKRPPAGNDTFVGELIFDKGMEGTAFFLTANAAGEFTRTDTSRHDTTYRASMRGRWEFVAATIGKRGAYFDLTGEAKKHTSEPNVVKAQGKLTIPLSGGVDLPISVTWANRKDLIQESRITGHIGFTIDFSKLTELIHSK